MQEAVRAELGRQRLLEETDHYISELLAEVGEPSTEAVARAEALSRNIRQENPTISPPTRSM